jgi:hypothetical protein
MKNAFTKTLALTLTLSALALAAGPAKEARAENWCPIQLSDCSPAETAFYITFSPITLPVTSVALSSMSVNNYKMAVAQAAVEDVAVYYDSGRLTGVLPSVLENTKSVLAAERGVSAIDISDAEAVDHIAAVAEGVLN